MGDALKALRCLRCSDVPLMIRNRSGRAPWVSDFTATRRAHAQMPGWRWPGRSCRAPWSHVRVVWVKRVRAEYWGMAGWQVLAPSGALVGIYLGLRYSFGCFSMVSFEILSSSGVFWDRSSAEMAVGSSGRAAGRTLGAPRNQLCRNRARAWEPSWWWWRLSGFALMPRQALVLSLGCLASTSVFQHHGGC